MKRMLINATQPEERRLAIVAHSSQDAAHDGAEQVIEPPVGEADHRLCRHDRLGEGDLLLHDLEPGGVQGVVLVGQRGGKRVGLELGRGVGTLLQQLDQSH